MTPERFVTALLQPLLQVEPAAVRSAADAVTDWVVEGPAPERAPPRLDTRAEVDRWSGQPRTRIGVRFRFDGRWKDCALLLPDADPDTLGAGWRALADDVRARLRRLAGEAR